MFNSIYTNWCAYSLSFNLVLMNKKQPNKWEQHLNIRLFVSWLQSWTDGGARMAPFIIHINRNHYYCWWCFEIENVRRRHAGLTHVLLRRTNRQSYFGLRILICRRRCDIGKHVILILWRSSRGFRQFRKLKYHHLCTRADINQQIAYESWQLQQIQQIIHEI